MSSFIAFVLLSVSLSASAGGAGQPEAEKAELARIKKLFAERDLVPLQRLYYHGGIGRIKNLPLAYRNEVALVAAQHLALGSYRKGISDKDFWLTLTKGTHPELNRQWGLNVVAMNILRELSEQRLITEPKVLPLLIEALDYPLTEERRQVYYSLNFLTKRRVGDDVWGRGMSDAATEPGLRKWWRAWWQANKDKSPIYTRDLEARVKKRVEEIYRDVDVRLAPKFDELYDLKTFDYCLYVHPSSRVVGEIDYDPGRRAYPAIPRGKQKPIRFDKLPRMRVEARLQTPNPKGAAPDKQLLPSKDNTEVVHREMLPGTDIEVRVLVATPNADLVRALRGLFKKGDKKDQ